MKIGKYEINNDNPVFIIAEIGINHNGDLDKAKQLIKASKTAGCNAVKFQKRTIDTVYSADDLAKPRESPFGKTNGDLKRGLEFSYEDYFQIDNYCKEIDMIWFASPWDEASVDFLESFNVPCHKVAAACLTDAGLLHKLKTTDKPILLSTGMSEIEEIDKAVAILGESNLMLYYCVSLYPPPVDKINLLGIKTLIDRYGVPVGYSGHELDTIISVAAVALGAVSVERHFTLDRVSWGSDHVASIEPLEMNEMIKNIRLVEQAFGSSEITCLDEEVPIKHKLRRVDNI